MSVQKDKLNTTISNLGDDLRPIHQFSTTQQSVFTGSNSAARNYNTSVPIEDLPRNADDFNNHHIMMTSPRTVLKNTSIPSHITATPANFFKNRMVDQKRNTVNPDLAYKGNDQRGPIMRNNRT